MVKLSENQENHQEVMEKKSKKSIKKYEIHMLGTGMFRDFDEINKNEVKKKVLENLQEDNNETQSEM